MTRSNDRKPKSNSPEPFDEAFGEMLCAYLDDELSPAQRAEVEARLESDATARAQLEMLTSAASAMRSLPRGSAPSSILEDITAQSERAEILGKPEDTITLARHKRGPFRSTMALAAMLMVAVSASLYVSLNSQQNASHPRGAESVSQSRPATSSRPDETILAFGDKSKDGEQELFKRADENAGIKVETFAKESVDSTAKRDAAPPASTPSSKIELGTELVQTADADAATAEEKADATPASRRRGRERLAQATRSKKSERALETVDADRDDTAEGKVNSAKDIVTVGDDALADNVLTFDQPPTPTGPPPPSPSEEHAEQPSRQLVMLDPDMTLEQKLLAGADATVVASHPFLNEPLQLSVSFENDSEQAEGEKQLQAFLGRNGVRPIEALATSRGFAEAVENKNGPESDEAIDHEDNALECESYYVGQASNFIAPANSRQYLVRISSDKLGEVVNDLSTTGAEEVQLRVGNVLSQNSQELWQLASQAAGEEFEPPPAELARSKELRRLQAGYESQAKDAEDKASLTETAQWIQALQSYGLLPDESAEEPQVAGGFGNQNPGAAGGFGGGGGGGANATTNALPVESASGGKPAMAKAPQKQQTLLTLVIELINDQAPGKKEPPTKLKQ
ncbi:MAG TPA: hypothetical protein PKN33_12040 [Phycisphaerae bacterium]|nr:hypothetical protein [Phycisphaerae bacterium]